MSSVVFPDFVINTKTEVPRETTRLFNGRKLSVWSCKVEVNKIVGWVDNPRIDLEKKRHQSTYGERELTQDEIFDIMKNTKDVKLKELRDDILKNGLRNPLTLSWSGKLLDGNRRFFALKYALESISPTDPNRQDLEWAPAFILKESATDVDERHVLVEENFSPSLKIEWPDYVKAQKVVEYYEKYGPGSEGQVAKLLGWSKRKVTETLQIDEIIKSFLGYATTPEDPEDEWGGGLGMSEMDAEKICSERYQYFNEAKKSFAAPLKTEPDFAMQFFKWIAEGKFSSFQEARIAYKAWSDPKIRQVLLQKDPSAAKNAKAILDYNVAVGAVSQNLEEEIAKFSDFLKKVTFEQLLSVSPEIRERFNEIANRFNSVLEQIEKNDSRN